MRSQDDAFTRHQQTRWLRHDAHRWVRPDAARFLKPGTKVEDVFHALALKYSQNQPRVPKGNGGESGRWTDGNSSGRPRVYIYGSDPDSSESGDGGSDDSGSSPLQGSTDVGDIASEIDKFDLFGIKPRERGTGGIQLAGDPPPGIGDNGGPPLDEPPEIPQKMPEAGKTMKFVRDAIRWLARVGPASAAAGAFIDAAEEISEIKRLTDMMKTANDPPRELDELIERAKGPSQPGYQKHHIAEQDAARKDGFPESMIQQRDNIALVPTVKHIDITADYMTKILQPDGTVRSLRNYLHGKDFQTRQEIGRAMMRKHGVLK